MTDIEIKVLHQVATFPGEEDFARKYHEVFLLERSLSFREQDRLERVAPKTLSDANVLSTLSLLFSPSDEYLTVTQFLLASGIAFSHKEISRIQCEYELNKHNTYNEAGDVIAEDNFIVPAAWLLKFWEEHRNDMPTRASTFDTFLEMYSPDEDGQCIYDAACYDGVIVYDGIAGR